MSISIEVSASIYDSQIARQLKYNPEFFANVLIQLNDLDEDDRRVLSDFLDEHSIKVIRQLQKAADLCEAAS